MTHQKPLQHPHSNHPVQLRTSRLHFHRCFGRWISRFGLENGPDGPPSHRAPRSWTLAREVSPASRPILVARHNKCCHLLPGQPGATIMDTASSYSLEDIQLGIAAPCNSRAAAICAPDSSTNCWNFACAARVQEASASAHCQWGSHWKVVIAVAAAAGGWIVSLVSLVPLVSDLDGLGELLGWDAACDVFGPCVVDSGAGGPNEVDVSDVTSCSMP